jgi:hypothetical protein
MYPYKVGFPHMRYYNTAALSKMLDHQESTIIKHWARTRNNLEKQGLIVERFGTGKYARYTVHYDNGDEYLPPEGIEFLCE